MIQVHQYVMWEMNDLKTSRVITNMASLGNNTASL